MQAVYRTDTGRKREINEDYLLADEKRGIFLLADGLGGHQAGEVASEVAVKEAYEYLKDQAEQTRDKNTFLNLLSEAAIHAHNAVMKRASGDPALMGMGTTLVIIVIEGLQAYICHVGDSRAYFISGGIRQITRDHSLGNYFFDIIALEHSPIRRRSNVLAQAVGAGDEIAPETNFIELKGGDIMLMCSDGLTDMLSDEEIAGIVIRYEDDIDGAAGELVECANKKGGIDNISVILIRV